MKLLRRLLVFDPTQRATAAQVLEDEIFASILKPGGKPTRTDISRAKFEVNFGSWRHYMLNIFVVF